MATMMGIGVSALAKSVSFAIDENVYAKGMLVTPINIGTEKGLPGPPLLALTS
jgi:hypothetical protein